MCKFEIGCSLVFTLLFLGAQQNNESELDTFG